MPASEQEKVEIHGASVVQCCTYSRQQIIMSARTGQMPLSEQLPHWARRCLPLDRAPCTLYKNACVHLCRSSLDTTFSRISSAKSFPSRRSGEEFNTRDVTMADGASQG